jgi:hypothetical protein
MFVELEKDAPRGQSRSIAVNVNHVLKVEAQPPNLGLRGQATTMLHYSNGQNDIVLGDLQTTLKRLDGADVTSLG